MASSTSDGCLIEKFERWAPSAPTASSTTDRSVHLTWRRCVDEAPAPFERIRHALLYRVRMYDKLNGWHQIYCGGGTSRVIDHLPPSHTHKFTIQFILRDARGACAAVTSQTHQHHDRGNDRLAESACSDALTVSTGGAGSSLVCFCLAVKGGHAAQVLSILEERPTIVNIVNATTGLTPLATAIMKGDLDMVKLLLSHGADTELCAADGKRALHVALAHGRYDIALYLADNGADMQARDVNGLRVEHMCVRSAECVRGLRERGADFTVTDCSGMTPLHHAVSGGAPYEALQLLVQCGCDAGARDRRGLDAMDAGGTARANDARLRRVLQRAGGGDSDAKHAFTRITNIIARLQTITKTT